MNKSSITVDPDLISEKIKFHQTEISRLNMLLGSIESLREFSPPIHHASTKIRRGRPTKTNPLYAQLKAFISHQPGEFTNNQMLEVVGDDVDRQVFFGAIKQLEEERLLATIVKPIGRRVGLYKRMEGVK